MRLGSRKLRQVEAAFASGFVKIERRESQANAKLLHLKARQATHKSLVAQPGLTKRAKTAEKWDPNLLVRNI